MNSSLNDYANEMPEEVRWTLKGFRDDVTLGLLIALMKNGKMSFNQMKDRFDLSSSSLSNILNTLQDGNLIQNFYEKTDKRSFSYYDVTDIPEQVFDSIYNILFSSNDEQPTIIKNNLRKDEQTTEKEEIDNTAEQTNTSWKLIRTEISNKYLQNTDVGSA